METKYVNTFNYYDFSSLKQLKSEADSENEASLKVIASQLESVFLQMVMKNMQDANESFKSDIFSRDKEDFYQDMLNQQMALSLSKAGGIGLADMIVQQLKGAGKTLPQQTGMLPLVAQSNKIKKESIQAQIEPNVEPKVSSPSTKVNEFVEVLLPIAKQVAGMIGIDPKLLIAQSALETGWGKHMIHDENQVNANNLFGVKAFSSRDEQVTAQTTEYVDNQPIRQQAAFKSYDSMMDSLLDYVKLLQTKRYEKALANVEDPKAFLTELQNAGYATDPQYADKVLAIYENHPYLNEV